MTAINCFQAATQDGSLERKKDIRARLRREHDFVTLDAEQQQFLRTLSDGGGILLAADAMAETGFRPHKFSRVRQSLAQEGMLGTFICILGLMEEGAAFVDPKLERHRLR